VEFAVKNSTFRSTQRHSTAAAIAKNAWLIVAILNVKKRYAG